MTWYASSVIANLKQVDEAAVQESLLPEEKCQLCGRELAKLSHTSHICGQCHRVFRPLKKYCLTDIDSRINHGHGASFFSALDTAIKRGDFK